jgi:hypothetical protein
MKNWILAAAFLGAVSLQTVGATPLSLGFSSIPGSLIDFDGAGNFTFSNSGTNDFQINNDQGGTNSALGLFGNLSGTFAIGVISGGGTFAPVTGTGSLIIHDGVNDLTASVDWVDITTSGTGSTLNSNAVANLTGITYSGTNADLLTIKNSLVASGTLSFTFNPAVSLSDLKSNGTHATTYSGTLTATPEPMTFSLLGAGLLGLGLLRKRIGRS